MLDVRRNQKLEIVQQLNLEKARLRLEVEIGKAPPLSDDEIWLELRDKAYKPFLCYSKHCGIGILICRLL